MEPTFKRSLRWTLIMAILGFILGLGFLIPLNPPETRQPASGEANGIAFTAPKGFTAENRLSNTVDPRKDVLFDIHVISRSVFTKGTDAYVTTEFTNDSRDEISEFAYCHNYDYSTQHARTNLNRYSLGNNGFDCYRLSLSELTTEYALIDTPLGKLLSLKTQPGFDPRKGGMISVLFTYRLAKFGGNDNRRLDFSVTISNGVVQIGGPKNEAFDWLNLIMSEGVFNLPNGINSFELYEKSNKVSEYAGDIFPKVVGRTKR
jgi:hypothetical protein